MNRIVNDPVSAQIAALLETLTNCKQPTRKLMSALSLSRRQTFRKNYLRSALESGLIESAIPDMPIGKLQEYRRTR